MFWENFVKLCVTNNTKPNPVARALGLSSGSVTKWKNGAKPNDTTLIKIADYFHVSVDFLLTGSEESETASHIDSARTAEFLSLFQQLTEEQQTVAIAFIKGILSGQ